MNSPCPSHRSPPPALVSPNTDTSCSLLPKKIIRGFFLGLRCQRACEQYRKSTLPPTEFGCLCFIMIGLESDLERGGCLLSLRCEGPHFVLQEALWPGSTECISGDLFHLPLFPLETVTPRGLRAAVMATMPGRTEKPWGPAVTALLN